MSGEALATVSDDGAMNDSAQVSAVEPLDNDDGMGAVWDKHNVTNGSERGEDGRFKSPGADDAETVDASPDASEAVTEPLEGGDGEGQGDAETSPPVNSVPLPSNWRGLEDTWSKIPEELRGPIAEHEGKLHQTLSQQGQLLAQYKPIGETIGRYKEYFGGERGNHKPAEAIEYLFNVQKMLDDKPLETWLEVANRYGIIDQIKQAVGATGTQQAGEQTEGQSGQDQTAFTNALLAKIEGLENTIQRMNDPSRFDERISQRLNEDRESEDAIRAIEASRNDMPLFDQIDPDYFVFFINRSRDRLGPTASKEAVLKSAYDQAVNADPDLRKQVAAPPPPQMAQAAANEQKRVAAAKRANSTNIPSTSSGSPRQRTEDELLKEVYDRLKGD